MPVQPLTSTDPDGTGQLVACRDGSVILHLTCAGTQGSVRLNISRPAQLSTGICEAAGVSQKLSTHRWMPPPTWPNSSAPPVKSTSGIRVRAGERGVFSDVAGARSE
ncbi:MAG: hypothetical protein ACRDSR_26965 [Pseudonocardiaceae bacterium]